MQDKSVIEKFLQLRPDEQVAVADHLPTSDVLNYALISKQYWTLSQRRTIHRASF